MISLNKADIIDIQKNFIDYVNENSLLYDISIAKLTSKLNSLYEHINNNVHGWENVTDDFKRVININEQELELINSSLEYYNKEKIQ